jgi:hypothetical protein
MNSLVLGACALAAAQAAAAGRRDAIDTESRGEGRAGGHQAAD